MHGKYVRVSLSIKEVIGGYFSYEEDTTLCGKNYG